MKHKSKPKEFPKYGYCSGCGEKLYFDDATHAVKVFGDHAAKKPKGHAQIRLLWEKPK